MYYYYIYRKNSIVNAGKIKSKQTAGPSAAGHSEEAWRALQRGQFGRPCEGRAGRYQRRRPEVQQEPAVPEVLLWLSRENFVFLHILNLHGIFAFGSKKILCETRQL